MKKKLILGFIIALSFGTISTVSYAFKSKTTVKKEITTQSQRVYICGGKYATKFHSRDNCRGLNNCKSDIYYFDSAKEAQDNGYDYCSICWK